MIILAIETSCDETSVAVLKAEKEILSNIVLSQVDIHEVFGGVVPEIASRNHIKHISRILYKAIDEANIKIKDIDYVAVTKGPGLIGSLLVGINAASSFAYANNIPLIGVNHLIGHIYAANIEHEMKFPALALLISGGHTELIYMENHMKFKMLGTTHDDAVGEAYDKVARTLGLSYPGGPIIDKLAKLGNDTYNLPRPMIDQDNYDFSFSGLKSAVINLVHNKKQKNEEININDMCRSFQESVIDVLIHKTKKASDDFKVKQIIVAGGVASNSRLRERITKEIAKEIVIPRREYCTDNAAMIAAAAYYYKEHNLVLPNYLLGGESTLSSEEL